MYMTGLGNLVSEQRERLRGNRFRSAKKIQRLRTSLLTRLWNAHGIYRIYVAVWLNQSTWDLIVCVVFMGSP